MTPGPWQSVVENDETVDGRCYVIDANLRLIASFCSEANARAIAALPELMEWANEFVALEEEALRDWANDTLRPPTGNEPFMVRLRNLKTILTKMEGKP